MTGRLGTVEKSHKNPLGCCSLSDWAVVYRFLWWLDKRRLRSGSSKMRKLRRRQRGCWRLGMAAAADGSRRGRLDECLYRVLWRCCENSAFESLLKNEDAAAAVCWRMMRLTGCWRDSRVEMTVLWRAPRWDRVVDRVSTLYFKPFGRGDVAKVPRYHLNRRRRFVGGWSCWPSVGGAREWNWRRHDIPLDEIEWSTKFQRSASSSLVVVALQRYQVTL